MRVRTYGLIVLVLVGIAPLAIYGALAIQRSQRTSIAQVRQGNAHLAASVAVTIRDHVVHQQRVLAVLGATVLQSQRPELAYEAIELNPDYERFHHMVVYAMQDGALHPVAGAPASGQEAAFLELARDVVKGNSVPLVVGRIENNPSFGQVMTIAQPIVIAGAMEGAVVSSYDLVGVWMTIGSIRINHTGFIRLISMRGDTIAHGHPDERRTAFMADQDENIPLLQAARSGRVTTNLQGQEIVASAAEVSGLAWRDPTYGWLVLVEQSVDEAFADVQAMKRALIVVGVGVLVFAIVVAMLVGRSLVRGLEHLRAHTTQLPGNLERRLQFQSVLKELSDLAESIDGMAADLAKERDEAQKRERLTTFARVAAGLAHDLRLPIENVRDACEGMLQHPEDDRSQDWMRKISRRELPRLKRFVDDLQRLARQGELELAAETTDPVDVARDVCAELSGTRKWSGVNFEVRGQASPAPMDRNLIRRAVLNLAANGADACLSRGPGHGVFIEVRDTKDMSAVEFRIEDNGPGISAEELAKLEQGDFHSSKRASGIGLGLGVARQVAATHHGQLSMTSEPGTGSIFTLRLPRRSVRPDGP